MGVCKPATTTILGVIVCAFIWYCTIITQKENILYMFSGIRPENTDQITGFIYFYWFSYHTPLSLFGGL